MSHRYTLPILGALVFGSAVLGVHLGNSAIANINPLYFQGAPVHPRDRGAAIEEPAVPEAPLYASQYDVEDGIAARDEDCAAACVRAMRARMDYPSAFVPDEPRTSRRVAAQESAADDWPEEEGGDYAVEYAEVERYASFPVASEEVEGVDLQE